MDELERQFKKFEMYNELSKAYPEIDRIVIDALENNEEMYFKTDKEIIACKPMDVFDEKKPENFFYKLDVRMDHGEVKCGLELIDLKELLYLEEHMPVLNYMGKFFPYDSFNKTWSNTTDIFEK